MTVEKMSNCLNDWTGVRRMSFETAGRAPRRSPEFEAQPVDDAKRPVNDRTQRALGRAGTANTVQNPSSARSERAQRALGQTAVEGTGAFRTRSRDRS